VADELAHSLGSEGDTVTRRRGTSPIEADALELSLAGRFSGPRSWRTKKASGAARPLTVTSLRDIQIVGHVALSCAGQRNGQPSDVA
jgi:hypothetical protein